MITDKASSAFSRELEAQIKGHVCYCGEGLHVAWLEGEYKTRCRNNHVNEATQRVKSDWQLWKEGILVDPYRDQQAARKRERDRRRDAEQKPA